MTILFVLSIGVYRSFWIPGAAAPGVLLTVKPPRPQSP
ncbi:hypothetical protein SAMN05216511_1086 [Streptomyces sp. KS_16]|nr:hypothetical protein BX261_6168 [Streptomyces sp. 2321.6]SDQ96275.1 hypothetical protein SAMN05216511_1086 [Streptomyces sp. KS_16]SED88310.1 hypothetical protein SAMN05428940_6194 [Streptomyces sp. 2133.1]SNC72978.1 hypothetical protein SAMN06272741_6094 [Streptomyces sp. 2114.4]